MYTLILKHNVGKQLNYERKCFNIFSQLFYKLDSAFKLLYLKEEKLFDGK